MSADQTNTAEAVERWGIDQTMGRLRAYLYDKAAMHADAVTVCDEVDRLRSRITELEKALTTLADAADEVGVNYFDTDGMAADVAAMQEATIAARVLTEGVKHG